MERTPVELVPSLGLVDSEATGASLNGAVNAFRSYWLNVIAGIWGVGLIYFLGRLGASFYLLGGLVRGTNSVSDRRVLDALESCQQQLGLSRKVLLKESDGHMGPLTCGVLKPAIVLPCIMNSWSSDRLRAVLLHELAHIQRQDVASNIVARLSCSFYWFVPCAWFAMGRANFEREQACDDLVLGTGFDAPSYAKHLLDLACGSKREIASFSPAVGMAQSVGLERRVAVLLGAGVNRRRVSRMTLFMLGIVITLVCVPFAILAIEPTDAVQDDDTSSGKGEEDSNHNKGAFIQEDTALGLSLGGLPGDESTLSGSAPLRERVLGGDGNDREDSDDGSVKWVDGAGEQVYFDDIVDGDAEPKMTQVFRLEQLLAIKAADLVSSIFNVGVKSNRSSNSLLCVGSREELDRVADVLDGIESAASMMINQKRTIFRYVDDDWILGDTHSPSSKSGVIVTIIEIGGVRASEEISIQATFVSDRVESITLLVSITCPYAKVAEMIDQLEAAGISQVSVRLREKD